MNPSFSRVPGNLIEHLLVHKREMDTYSMCGPGRFLDDYSKDTFNFHMDVSQFEPENIKVKIAEGFVVIHGQHDEMIDEHGYVSREFTRRVEIPKDVNPDKIRSIYNRTGVLAIIAPLKKPDPYGEKPVRMEMQKQVGVLNEKVKVGQSVSVDERKLQAGVNKSDVGTATKATDDSEVVHEVQQTASVDDGSQQVGVDQSAGGTVTYE